MIDMAVRKLATKPVISINKAWCKGCGICAALCPQKVITLDSRKKAVVVRESACIGCGSCVWHCPDMAISLERE